MCVVDLTFGVAKILSFPSRYTNYISCLADINAHYILLFIADMDVRRHIRDHSMQSRRAHFPEAIPLQMAQWSQCAQAQQYPPG